MQKKRMIANQWIFTKRPYRLGSCQGVLSRQSKKVKPRNPRRRYGETSRTILSVASATRNSEEVRSTRVKMTIGCAWHARIPGKLTAQPAEQTLARMGH